MAELFELSPQSLSWFVLAGLLLNLSPGPDVLYVVTRSLRQGAWAGVLGGLGIALGCLVHILAAALGVSAIMASSVWAFTGLKTAGALYLAWMGVKLLLTRAQASPLQPTAIESLEPSQANHSKVLLGGFLTNVLNPKVALFFLAFVPQFIPASANHKSIDFVLLGLLFDFNSIFVSAAYAFLAAGLGQRSAAVRRGLHWLDRVAGLMFVGFGLRLATFENPLH